MKLTKSKLRIIIKEVLQETDGYSNLVKTNKEQQEVLDLLTKKVLDHEQRLVGRSSASSSESIN